MRPTSSESPPSPEQATPSARVTRSFEVDCRLAYTIDEPAHFLFQLHALDGMDQSVVSESLRITPTVPHHVFEDRRVGNRFLRLRAEPGPLSLRYKARVEVVRPVQARQRARELSIDELPDEVLRYLMPTRYCESDLMGSAAQRIFGQHAPGWRRVKAISDWIHEHVDYRIGSTDATSTARDVFVQRAGVCRDFAHLGVTFCRALNIPARLAVGYARFDKPPPDFHAVFEAYLDGGWQLFDPTRMSPVEDLVRIAVGRDAKDVAFATIFGAVTTRKIWPCVEGVEG
ncbi:transglutaminase-like domain-containing protein [Aquabacterium sp. J223]|uniref:transglutaminase-like domain-containing protein n=1 Tax=Aquabacterium sp. J223 TaxID=2898431 RepID=UPI0021AE1B17|nr:transglutaminase family protein [Aquabacterium sp. J223]UUX96960.1 transglutaminase family protein [Aquabacterium sp. J223]